MNTLRFRRTLLLSPFTPLPQRSWARDCTLALITAAALAAGTPALAQPTTAAPTQASAPALDERFDQAMQAYERNHWPQAFEAFLQLAEQGHGDAARLVMQMHAHGQQLYGQAFALTPLQRARFSRQGRGS